MSDTQHTPVNTGSAGPSPKDRPNILFILTDDQGAWALGSAGNSEVRTPNLDRLAAEGIRFENFFCTSPVCSPARGSILTGKMPSQHGVQDFLLWGEREGRADDIRFLEDHKCSPEILADAGYTNGLSGKWHLGFSLEPQAGFHTWHPMPHGGTQYYKPRLVEDGQIHQRDGVYATDLFTDNALKFLREDVKEGQPWCLHVHYTAPHSPWERHHHPEELWDDYYNNCPFDSTPSTEPPPDYLMTRDTTPERRRVALSGYYASIEAMDRNVGRLLDHLEQTGQRENTLVVFMSDNGMNMGHHGVYGKGNATWPQNMFDTSVKVPCIISRPGSVPRGVVEPNLFSQYDWLPTMVDYLGLSPDVLPDNLPGKSFAPILRGRELPDPNHCLVVYDEYGPTRMIRNRQWKLVWRHPAGPHELYNLVEDPKEHRNLFDFKGNMDVIESLQKTMEQWFKKYTDPRFDGKTKPNTGHGQKDWPDAPNAFRVRFPEEWLPERPE
jgi:arylsulfatase A-like enzyme